MLNAIVINHCRQQQVQRRVEVQNPVPSFAGYTATSLGADKINLILFSSMSRPPCMLHFNWPVKAFLMMSQQQSRRSIIALQFLTALLVMSQQQHKLLCCSLLISAAAARWHACDDLRTDDGHAVLPQLMSYARQACLARQDLHHKHLAIYAR